MIKPQQEMCQGAPRDTSTRHGRIRPSTIILSALLIGLTAIIATGVLIRNWTNHPEPPIQIHLATVKGPFAASIRLADQLGYFADEGLDVQVECFPSGRDALASLTEPGLRLATSADIPAGIAIAEGKPYWVLASLASLVDLTVIAYRSDHGISRIQDLSGKHVGIITDTTSEYYLDMMLDLYGIPKGTVTIVAMEPEKLDDALLTGDLDAAVLWSPHSEHIRAKIPDKIGIFGNEGLYHWSWLLLSERNDPEAQAAFAHVLRALIRASTELSTDEEAHAKEFGPWLNLSPELVVGLWSWCSFDVQLSQSTLIQLENAVLWRNAKLINPEPEQHVDILSRIDPLPLSMVDPIRTQLIHPLIP